LRKSDEKDEINGEESQQIGVYHLVDHYHERPDGTKPSEQQHIITISTSFNSD